MARDLCGVHVFAGRFASREEAILYTEPQSEPMPPDDASDEQWAAWESRNPSWPMQTDLGGPHLDSDFIETIDGPEAFAYLEAMLVDKSGIQTIRGRAPADANILVLIFEQALGGFPARMTSTPRLTYCGEWQVGLDLFVPA
jgi:hypothetical protein